MDSDQPQIAATGPRMESPSTSTYEEHPLLDTPPSGVHESGQPQANEQVAPQPTPRQASQGGQDVTPERLSSQISQRPGSSEEAEPKDDLTQEWRPWSLSWSFNIPLFLIEIAFIATVIGLERRSATHNGIVDVPHNTVSSGRFGRFVHNYYSLLWTFLPAFLFNLYGLAWAAVVSDSASRQPYIELKRGAPALRTIMLDYKSVKAWKVWFVAAKNKHGHLTIGMVLAWFVSNVFSALASHLVVSLSAEFLTPVTLTYTTSFDASLLGSQTNLQPFIFRSTAVQVYNSSAPVWTTDTYAFQRFAIPDSTTVTGNVTADVSAYSALLECKTITPAEYDFKLGSSSNTDNTATVKFVDRGCNVTQILTIGSIAPIYTTTWYSACENSVTGRFGLFVGQYSASSDTKLKNFSVTSCVPTYWRTNGSLTMAYSNGGNSTSDPTYVGFTGHSETQINPDIQLSFEEALTDYTIFNPANGAFADSVGYTIYSAAQQRSAQTMPGASDILESMQAVFATIFASMTSSVLLSTPATPDNGTGTLTVQKDRLFVASTIAYIFVGAMAVVLVCHILLFWYGKRHETMLDEEPVGLLGAAKLLRRSEVLEVVDHFETRHAQDGKMGVMQKYMRKHYHLGRGDRCWWEGQDKSIKVVGMTED